MVMLSTLDLVLIFIYLAVLIAIGYFSARKQKEESYLIAERKLGPWSTMATINASKTGSILMIFVALVYLWGFSALWYFVGMTFGILLFLPFALKLKESSKQRFYTLADYFKYNYGKKSAIIASLITIFLMFGFLVLNLIAGTKIFIFFTGWAFWLCASILIVIVLIYLLMGGFKAVVKTDVLQYIVMVVILALLALTLFKGSLIPISEWIFFKADIITMAGFFIVGLLFPFAMPDMWQRVYSARDKKALKKGIFTSAIVYMVFAFLLALVALTIKMQFPGIDPDLALIHGFGNLLPVGFLGFASILLFAAIMSSIDTYIFTGASSITQDFFDWDKKTTVKHLKRVIFGLAIIGTIIAILLQNLMIGSYIFVASLVILSVAVIATWINKNIKQRTLLFGLIFGIIGFVIFLIMSLLKGHIDPTIVIITLGSSLVGLIIGRIVSIFKK